jgi:zeaxanthin glucosyltransferase
MRRRFLFVSLPLTGHLNPMAAVADAVARRGHDVAWVGSESFLRPVLGPDATIHPVGLRLHRGQSDRGLTALRSRWAGYIVPHSRHCLPAVDRAVVEHRPDVMVVDQHAVAGALVAHRHGITWATAAPTTTELTRPYRGLPKVEQWVQDRLAGLWTGAGLPGTPPHDLRFSPHQVLAFTSEALMGPACTPAAVTFVGPALKARPGTPFPWHRVDPGRRLVLVTMGTLAMDVAAGFYRRILEALRPLGDTVQAVVIAPDGTLADPPPHVLTVPYAPVLELMPRLDAVVSHGGLNTVTEALAHAVPLVVAPISADQPINADRVARVGAGRRVRFERSTPQELRQALLAVLDDPGHRAAAGRIRDSFTAAGGAPAAARHLEALAGAVPHPLSESESRT